MNKRINFHVSEKEHKKLKMEAAKLGISIKALFMNAVKAYRKKVFDKLK